MTAEALPSQEEMEARALMRAAQAGPMDPDWPTPLFESADHAWTTPVWQTTVCGVDMGLRLLSEHGALAAWGRQHLGSDDFGHLVMEAQFRVRSTGRCDVPQPSAVVGDLELRVGPYRWRAFRTRYQRLLADADALASWVQEGSSVMVVGRLVKTFRGA